MAKKEKKIKPCKLCPFKKDCLPGWLGEHRAAEIAQSALADETFFCHKTLDDEHEIGEGSKPCAGSVLLATKEGGANRYYRYIAHEYSGEELVFDSVKQMVKHHSDNGRRKRKR